MRSPVRPVSLAVCLLSAALVLGIAVPEAGARRTITLAEALQLTLDYSRDILIAKEGKRQSEGRYVEERSAALPHLEADAQAVRAHDEYEIAPGVGLEKNEYGANLNLSQALYTWGQIGAAIKAAKFDRTSTEHQIREARQLALREAATAFYNLLLAYELEKVARDNYDQKRRHLEEAEKKLRMEVATDYDVLSARVALDNARPDLSQAENTVRLARDRLRYYMGLEEDFEIEGTLTCQPLSPPSLASVLESAKANRPEVAYYESRVGVFKELIKVAKAGDKPRLDFKGNLGWGSYEDIDSDYPGQHWDAGVYLSFPFFDGFKTKGRVIQAESRLATTEYEMKRLLDNIALEARDAINRVDEAAQVMKALQTTTQQAQRLLEMAEAGYRYGVKTTLEVDDAQFNTVSAFSSTARARRDYLVAMARLEWIKGEDLQSALTRSTCPVGAQ